MNASGHAGYPHQDDAIEVAAAHWLVERAEGLSAEQLRDFEQWRRADPRHAAAVERLEQTQALLERLPFAADRLEDIREERMSPPRSARRRPWHAGAGLAAAAAAVAVVAWWQWPAATPEASQLHYRTAAAGYERILLDDGSTLELNAASEVRVDFSVAERRVALLAGEAHFNVSRDPERPFVVTAGEYSVRAVGTAFNVRFAPVAVEVLVTQGKVLVSQAGAASPVHVTAEDEPLLGAGQRVVIEAGTRPSARRVENVDSATMRAALAWQESRLYFTETPLREVVRQFNQRNRTQLILGDTDLGAQLVGGTFASDNVEAFVRLLENSGDIVSERPGAHEIVLRKVR